MNKKTKNIDVNINLNNIYAQVLNEHRLVMEFKAESYIKQFLDYMKAILQGSFNSSLRHTGASTSFQPQLRDIAVTGSTSTLRRGLHIGSSADARSIEDYTLKNLLTEGFSFGSVAVDNLVSDETNNYFDIYRTVIASDNITINEIGLMVANTATSSFIKCITSDVLPAEVVLSDSESRTFRYRLKFNDFLENFGILFQSGARHNNASIIDTDGNPSSITSGSNISCNANLNETHLGIAVGQGDTPVQRNDYSLDNRYGDNNVFKHLPSLISNVGVDAGDNTGKVSIVRGFLNVTENPVDVNEVGLIIGTTDVQTLIHRKVLSSPVTIPADELLSVAYNFTIET